MGSVFDTKLPILLRMIERPSANLLSIKGMEKQSSEFSRIEAPESSLGKDPVTLHDPKTINADFSHTQEPCISIQDESLGFVKTKDCKLKRLWGKAGDTGQEGNGENQKV